MNAEGPGRSGIRTGYEQKSVIGTIFPIENGYLHFSCTNNIDVFYEKDPEGGIQQTAA